MVLALELVDAIFAETGKIAFGRGSARRGKFGRRATFDRFTHRVPVELARSVTNLKKVIYFFRRLFFKQAVNVHRLKLC